MPVSAEIISLARRYEAIGESRGLDRDAAGAALGRYMEAIRIEALPIIWAYDGIEALLEAAAREKHPYPRAEQHPTNPSSDGGFIFPAQRGPRDWAAWRKLLRSGLPPEATFPDVDTRSWVWGQLDRLARQLVIREAEWDVSLLLK